MVMNGDLLLHNTLWDSAHLDAERTGRGDMDFRPMLSDLQPLVSSADLAICHLETPLAPPGGPYSSYPVFSVPPQIVPAIKCDGLRRLHDGVQPQPGRGVRRDRPDPA